MEKRDLQTATTAADPTRILFYPSIWSTFFYQSGVTQTNYDLAGNVTATTSTSYNYDMDLWYGDDLNRHKQLKYTSTTKSDGDIVTTSYSYPGDFLAAESDETVRSMREERFMHSAPLVVTQSVSKSDATKADGIVHRAINKYGIVNGKVVLTNKFSTELTGPLPSLPVYTPSLTTMPPEYKSQVTIDYDADGNPNKVIKKDNYTIGYLWGYNKAQPTVQVSNATAAEVFYNGYEDQAITGSHTAPLGAGNGYKAGGTETVHFQPPSSRPYVLSYKYYENGAWKSTVIPYTPDGSYNYQINQGQHLDEVRVYPADAMLTTITYDVLYGKTSETDSNNRTTFYDYDVLGRLIGIRDNDKNIVKKFKYNYIIH
jgi:YD repeat-containing protein